MSGKRIAQALSVALELTLNETEDLLRRAGYEFDVMTIGMSDVDGQKWI